MSSPFLSPDSDSAGGSRVLERTARFDPAVIFGLTLLAYIFTMPRAITLEDAGLFQMVCHLDGIAHPPGYPLFTLLCKPLVQFPGVMNGNLLSSVFASLTAALFYMICLRLKGDRAFAWVSAIAYAFSNCFWSQAIIIEVYTLATLMFMICWWLLMGFSTTGKWKLWFVFCFAYGLSLSNHWPLMLLSTPGLAVMLWPARRILTERIRSPGFWTGSAVCFLAGLLPYLTLLLNRHPEVAVYGPIESFDGFLKYVTRAAYSDSLGRAGLDDKLAYALWLIKSGLLQFGHAGAPLLIVGLVIAVRTLPRWLNAGLALVYLGGTFVLLSMVHFEYSAFYRAIFRPYPIIACSALSLWFATGVVWLARLGSRYRHWIAPAVAAAACVLVFTDNFTDNDRRSSQFAKRFGETVLSSLPRNAVLFTEGDNETGLIGYLHLVKGLRQDIELRDWDNLVFANRLISPFASDEAQRGAITAYIRHTDRPVFTISDRLTPSIDLGLYREFADDGGIGFVPDLEAYLDYLLTLYEGEYIRDAHERHLAYRLLLAYARQYVDFRLTAGESALNAARRERLDRLQETFPGRAVTLKRWLEKGAAGQDRARLLAMAAAAESDIPDIATRESLATFYESYGRLLMLPPAEPVRAVHYFRLSLQTRPTPGNDSICRLRQIYETQGDHQALSDLESRFPDKQCRHPRE